MQHLRVATTVFGKTTHNLAGTHRCLNLDTLREVRGDVFLPIARLTTLAGSPPIEHTEPQSEEPLLANPNVSYPLPPDRGVDSDIPEVGDDLSADIVLANELDPKDNMLTPTLKTITNVDEMYSKVPG
jgi:hypothetical protein